MTTTGVWLPREPRNNAPAIVMRFHDDWWHTIFTTSANSHEVVLSPMGIGLGVYKTLAQAKAAAEDNARERALNTISTARRNMGRASQVLAALGTAAPSAQSGPVGPARRAADRRSDGGPFCTRGAEAVSVHMHTRLLNDGIDPRHVDRRLKELHALGLPYTDIAKVVRFYEGWHLSEDQVHRRLHQLGARKNPNKTRPKAGVR